MINEHTIDFLRRLKANNSRDWFMDHKPEYQMAYGDFFDTVVRMIASISSFDPAVAQAPPDPKSCIMRIYRDIRFSRDKTPYKTGFFAYVSSGGRKGPFGGYYLHLEPGASFAGGGLYLPEPRVLEKVRQSIDQRYPEWLSIVTDSGMLTRYPQGVEPSGVVKRPPKGYDASNPAIVYLKFKGYYTQHFFQDTEVTALDFIDELAVSHRAAMPLVAFLNRAVGEI